MKLVFSYGMHGNAWQMCADCYGADYYVDSPTDDPQGPDTGDNRVIRGGAWNYWPDVSRSARRDWETPDIRRSNAGFRVARMQ